MKDIIEKLNKSKVPIVKIDNSLEKFKKSNFFREKNEEANRTLSKTVLPQQLKVNIK